MLFFISIGAYVILSAIFVLAIIHNYFPGISLPKLSDAATTASTLIQATFAAAVVFGASMAVVAYASRAERIAERQKQAHVRISSIVGIQAVASAVDIVKNNVDSNIRVIDSAVGKVCKISSHPVIIADSIMRHIVDIKSQPINDKAIDSMTSSAAKDVASLTSEAMSAILDISNDIMRIINLPVSGEIAVERICDKRLIEKIKQKTINEDKKDDILCALFKDHINSDSTFSADIDCIIKRRFNELVGILVADLSRSIKNNVAEEQIKQVITMLLNSKYTGEKLYRAVQLMVCQVLSNDKDSLIMSIIANYYRYSSYITHDAYIKFIDIAADSINIGYEKSFKSETGDMAREIGRHLIDVYIPREPEERNPEFLGFICG